MNVSKNFDVKEFIPKETYQQWGEKAKWFIDKRVIDICQWLRDKTGKSVTINNWHMGGPRNESGLRQFGTITGAGMSQHKFGRAADVIISGMSSEEVRKLIKNNFTELKALGLTTIEKDTPTWCHFDCRFTGQDELLEVAFQ